MTEAKAKEQQMELTARNATLGDMRAILEDQQARKVDVVAPAHAIRAENGLILLDGTDARIDDDGVTPTEGLYRPTQVFDEGVAQKLGIPVAYLQRMRHQRPDLYDANVNGWLHGHDENPEWGPDPRSFLVRGFRSNGDPEGVARAFLSDRYKPMDYLDVMVAMLSGIRQSGMDVTVEATDLTERRLHVRVHSKEVAALAPTLLERYRSPWTGARGDDNPTVFGGFVFSNSEVGNGALTVVPRLLIQICTNGLQIKKDAIRKVHLGGQLDEGVIRWSDEAKEQHLRLITTQVRDAVRTFLDIDYVSRAIQEIEVESDATLSTPRETVEMVTQKLKFTKEHADGIFDVFVQSGDPTAGGVMNAVTAYAQTVDDADEAFEIEGQGLEALSLAARLA